MSKCGMCGFFGKCTHRKETDGAENCSQYHDDYYVKYNYPDQWEELVERTRQVSRMNTNKILCEGDCDKCESYKDGKCIHGYENVFPSWF